MKINRLTIVATISLVIFSIPVCSGPAQAYDPRAVVPGSTITGMVLDANGNNVPNATVKLLLDWQLFDVPRNPQQSSNGSSPYGSIGRYQFTRLPYSQYLIVVEASDAAGNVHRSNLTIDVSANTMTADIVLSDLVISSPTTPSPTPSYPPTHTPYREPCGLGLILPVLGLSVLIIGRKKNY